MSGDLAVTPMEHSTTPPWPAEADSDLTPPPAGPWIHRPTLRDPGDHIWALPVPLVKVTEEVHALKQLLLQSHLCAWHQYQL